ncbi:MAG TPA: tagaturonate epimerase family protein [Candidatus Sulfotelmatobacter sp.]|nr:tagaturonate epimerase family protein [Candidatus Sulfotelmatobacter sp.]
MALSQDYRLVAWGEDLQQIEGQRTSDDGNEIVVGPASHSNLQFLRASLPWLTPKLIGTKLSVGFGDRVGLATAGHIRAMRIAGRGVGPVFAQQSIREMSRSGRSPSQVVDDAAWGVFAEGWREGFGADADHVKSESDIDPCIAAGFTFYTIDPSEHVWNDADGATSGDVQAMVRSLPWRALEDSERNMLRRHRMPVEATVRAAAKYGRALAHVVGIDRYLSSRLGSGFELEVSVDETDTPTTPEQHEYMAVELRRLGVRFISLAPRFVGSFEKGVDYVGNVTDFETQFARHAEIAKHFGPYKLGLHSGSDKFSIYEIAARLSAGFLHLKTSGTSWLEGLRVVGTWDPDLLADIYALALDRYAEERASYHVSADCGDAPALADLGDSRVRQILHVTFGAVMRRYGPQLLEVLRAHRDDYEAEIETHFVRHLAPLQLAT